MKYYKVLQLFVLVCFVFSCSTDTFEQQDLDNSEARIAQDQFDNSHLGLYKGLFTTNDGLTRGTVEVTLTPDGVGMAKITLSSGEQIHFKSPQVKLTVDNNVENLRFSSEGLSDISSTLEFSVNGDGGQPTISNVRFDTKESDILIAKNLSRSPLTPITGTYVRTAGTQGFPNTGLTWNIMSIGAGNLQNFSIQIAYGGRIYNTPNANSVQSNCIDQEGLKRCNLNGLARILGYDVTFAGFHYYSLDSSQSCSSISGTWVAPSYGNSSGTFTSDVDAAACVGPAPEIPEVVIGTQTWMLRNLDVETYKNGDPIPQVQDPEAWAALTTGAWCYFNNDPANGQTYGKLYNSYAVTDPRGLGPEGYHVPSVTEWNTLNSFLGGTNLSAGRLKSVTGWTAPNAASNSSGFTGLPGGYRGPTGAFLNRFTWGYWHTNDNVNGSLYFARHETTSLNIAPYNVNNRVKLGLSVRCVKD